MQAVTVSFVQSEHDIVESQRHSLRHGNQRWLTFGSPVLVALVFGVPLWILLGDSPVLVVAASLGIGLLQLAFNWYLLPPLAVLRLLQWLGDLPPDSTTVRLAPDQISWSGPTSSFGVPWGIVSSVDTMPSGICVIAGRPSVSLWIPARSFPTPDDLAMTGQLAARYAVQATPVPRDDIEWPQNKQQRKVLVVFAVVCATQALLAVLLFLLLR